MDQPLDITGLIEAVSSVTDALERIPAWERRLGLVLQVLLATLTSIAVVYAAKSARSATSAAKAAREATDYARLRDLQAHFEDSGYLMRFWRIFAQANDMRKANGFWSAEVKGLKTSKHALLWKDALGGNPENTRYDMLVFYDFVLRLNAWVVRSPGNDPIDENVQLVNELFGPWLVGTMLKHRMVACIIKHPDRGRDYYIRYYGLLDDTYTTLVQALLDDLIARDRLVRVLKNAFSEWNRLVNEQLAELGTPPSPA